LTAEGYFSPLLLDSTAPGDMARALYFRFNRRRGERIYRKQINADGAKGPTSKPNNEEETFVFVIIAIIANPFPKKMSIDF